MGKLRTLSIPKYQKLEDVEPGDKSPLAFSVEEYKNEPEPLKHLTGIQPATNYWSTLPMLPVNCPNYGPPRMGSYQDPFLQPTCVIASQPVQCVEEPTHLFYSVCTMLFCCPLLGIAALIFSIKTHEANRNRNKEAAWRNSRQAGKFADLAVCVGIVLLTLSVAVALMAYDRIQNFLPS